MAFMQKVWLAVRFVELSCRVALRFLWIVPACALSLDRPRIFRARGPRPPLLLLHSQVAWWGVWQRPQEMALGLARRRRVLFLSPIQVHERLGRYSHSRCVERIERGKGVEVRSPLLFSGEYRWDWVFRLNRLLARAETRWMLRGERDVVFLSNTPLGATLLDTFAFRQVVYDVMDDFAAFDWAPHGTDRLHERMLEAAQVVFTGTYTLLESVRTRGYEATFVPCGVDAEAFRAGGAEPADLCGLPRPIIGYVGTLSERIDTRLLAALAARFPEASLALVGPVYRTLGEAPRAANIHYLGLKRHEELPAYMRRFAVALMPFRLTDAARAINPVKTLEYLAAGCVVVSTAIPDVVRFYSNVVLIADSSEDFIEKVAHALRDEHTKRIAAGVARAEASNWQSMVEAMEARL